MKVLVVDDVGLIRHSICRTLADFGIAALAAKCGTEAIAAIRADHSIDTVITDLMMPGMTGIELFRATQFIERCDDNGTVPPPGFILLTAIRAASEGGWANADLKAAMDMGFAAILHKPVSRGDLENALKSFQERRSADRDNRSEHFASLLQKIQQAGKEIRASGNSQVINQLDEVLRTQLTVAP